jgi:ribonuclease R
LITALGLGEDGLSQRDIAQMGGTAEIITFAERRAMAAEREATDRYVAAFLAEHVGAEFAGKITGVTRFGLFIKLADTGADGLAPISRLGDEYFSHDERSHALVGERSGARWPLGLSVTVKLIEATPLTGGLLFEMTSDPAPPDRSAPRPHLGPKRRPSGRPPGIRTGRKQKMGGKRR